MAQQHAEAPAPIDPQKIGTDQTGIDRFLMSDYGGEIPPRDPRMDEMSLIGRAAVLFTKDIEGAQKVDAKYGFGRISDWWQNRRATRAERKAARRENWAAERQMAKDRGSLGDLHFDDGTTIAPPEPTTYASQAYHELAEERAKPKEPRKVLATDNVYRSNFSVNQPEAPLGQQEQDDIMFEAAKRARAKLGELPVVQMVQPPERPGRHAAALDEKTRELKNLEDLYNQPSVQPPQPHIPAPRHAAPEEDDRELTSSGTQQ